MGKNKKEIEALKRQLNETDVALGGIKKELEYNPDATLMRNVYQMRYNPVRVKRLEVKMDLLLKYLELAFVPKAECEPKLVKKANA